MNDGTTRRLGTLTGERSWPRWPALVGVLLLGVGVLAWAIGRTPVAPGPLASDTATPALELLPQDLATVEVRRLSRNVPITGALEPRDWSEVKAQIAGQVAEVAVRSGETVTRGQLLARLDAREYESRLADRVAALAGARAQLELAKKKRESARALFERELLAQADRDTAESTYRVNVSAVESLAAQVEQSRKAVDDCEIRSPLDGVVAEREAQPGSAVTPSAKLFTVMDLSTLELAALVPASDIPAVRLGQEVVFRVEGFGERSFTGTVDRINPATEPGSRSIALYVTLANPAGELRGGMFAQGSLMVSESADTKVIPAAALHEQDGAAIVYRVQGDTIERRTVEVAVRDAESGLIGVASGLEPGDRVIVGNLAKVEPGMRVRISALDQPGS